MSEAAVESWDLVIRPRARWFDLNLDELWRYRDLVWLFVRRDFVAQFKQTILGPAWFVLQPLLSTLVFTVVFGHIAKLGTAGLPKPLFYLSGTVLWGYFSGCLLYTSNTFVSNAYIFGKVYFPRLTVPVSIVISHLLKLCLQFLFFLGFWAYFALRGAPVAMNAVAWLFPVCVLLMAVMSLGGGIMLSSMTTKYRDLRFLLDFGVQLLMYGTTVIYPLADVPERWRWLVMANPMTPVIETFRYGFLGAGSFSPWHLGYSAVVAVVLLALGVVMFTRVERTFMDTV